MKDKFEIFQKLISKEVQTNHFGIYITIGQMGNIMRQVSEIYNNWDDLLSMEENVNNYFFRSITPMGDAGKNRL